MNWSYKALNAAVIVDSLSVCLYKGPFGLMKSGTMTTNLETSVAVGSWGVLTLILILFSFAVEEI